MILRRKIDSFLIDQKNDKKFSLITKGVKKGTLKIDFILRDKDSLIPVEVKAVDGSAISLNKMIENKKYKDVKYGIKLCNKNIEFNGKFYTFPYFLTFLLKKI